MSFAQDERRQLCAVLEDVGPDAETLCEGWRTQDLAAHLWVRENDPLALPGIMGGPLGGLSQKRMARALDRMGYGGIVDALAEGPVSPSLFALPGMDASMNALEFFVHHEDVRRAPGQELEPRTLPDKLQDALWDRLHPMALVLLRSSEQQTVLVDERDPSRRLEVGTGPRTVVTGLPAELVLYAFGRRSAARVDVAAELPPANERVVHASRIVHAPAGRIFELIADPARQPEWDGNDNLDHADEGQRVRAIGDRFLMHNTSGRTRENEVVDFEEGRRIAWLPGDPGETKPGHRWAWELEPLEDGSTRVTHTYDWSRLTDERRFEKARNTTSENLMASIERLAAAVEG